MSELNEKLAVDVMGWHEEHEWETFWVNSVNRVQMIKNQWNPTTDLNQLKMCYDALSEDEKEAFAFNNRYAPTDWVFTNPELVAQAILNAKGVS